MASSSSSDGMRQDWNAVGGDRGRYLLTSPPTVNGQQKDGQPTDKRPALGWPSPAASPGVAVWGRERTGSETPGVSMVEGTIVWGLGAG